MLPAPSDTAFAPDDVVQRGDLARALHRFAGAPAVPETLPAVPLTDLGEDAELQAAALWLHGRGALWGDASLGVHPTEPATRDLTTRMLTALLRPALRGVGATWEAADDLAWLQAAGMLSAWPIGGSGSADADEPITRAELASALNQSDQVIAQALG